MRILITGANGLVGQGVLQECLRDPAVTGVVALGRHPSGQSHSKLTELICPDFSRLRAVEEQLQPFDACLYCAGAPPLGTSEMEYRHVTLELTGNVARAMARHNPGMTLVYVSGAHANAQSRLMPLRVKGETEEVLAALPIRTVMLRPGGIQPAHGERSPHAWMRPLYAVAAPLMGIGVRLAPGVMTSTAHLGRALLALAAMPAPPPVVENADINRLGAPG